MTGTSGAELMAHMGLRSRSNKNNKSQQDEDVSLKEKLFVQAEETMLRQEEEDEEIESIDGSGNPVADLEAHENRNLSVALARSREDAAAATTTTPPSSLGETTTSSGTTAAASSTSPMDDDSGGSQRRYGLRTRRIKGNDDEGTSATTEEPLSRMVSTDDSAANRIQTKASDPAAAQLSGGSVIPGPPKVTLVKPDPLPTIAAPPSSSSSSFAETRIVHKSSHGVPNPLAHRTTPQRSVPTAAATVTTSLQPATAVAAPVPCPLPATVAAAAVAPPEITPEPSGSFSTQLNDEPSVATKRGRIFSIDIDTDGLEFLPGENFAVDFGHSPTLRPMATPQPQTMTQPSGSVQHPGAQIPSNIADLSANFTAASCSSALPKMLPAPVPTPSTAAIALPDARCRAMSFELFSLGINHEEAPPPAPDAGLIGSMPMQQLPVMQRPRGDSIIFDPVSFQDGGILEEKALIKSRAHSMELPSQDEMAILNTPGFVSPPMPTATNAIQPKPMPGGAPFNNNKAGGAPNDPQQMATLPSSLNNTMNHATFQMDLLNKGGRIGIYLPDARRARIAKFHSKRKMRIWRKRIKYDCRKKLADSRPRIKGRFVKRSDMD